MTNPAINPAATHAIAEAASHSTSRLDSRLLRHQIDQYKLELRAGKMISGLRGTGKTTAILEVIHEDYAGDALVGCVTSTLAGLFKHQYHRFYPTDAIPRTFVPRSEDTLYAGLASRLRYDNIFFDVAGQLDYTVQRELRRYLDFRHATMKGSW